MDLSFFASLRISLTQCLKKSLNCSLIPPARSFIIWPFWRKTIRKNLWFYPPNAIRIAISHIQEISKLSYGCDLDFHRIEGGMMSFSLLDLLRSHFFRHCWLSRKFFFSLTYCCPTFLTMSFQFIMQKLWTVWNEYEFLNLSLNCRTHYGYSLDNTRCGCI